MKLPQKHPNLTPIRSVEWILTDANKKEILRSKPIIQDAEFEPIINDEGQTREEWLRDLRRREREEFFAKLPSLFFYAIGGLIVFLCQSVFIIPVILYMAVKAISSTVSDDVQSNNKSNVRQGVEMTTTTTTTTTTKIFNQ